MEQLKEIRQYWNMRADGYGEAIREELNSPGALQWRERFEKLLPPPPAKVLDCGMGPGFFTCILAEMGYAVWGVDYSDGMVEQAGKNLAALGLTAQLQQMDAQHLTFPDGYFDAVVSRNLLWNLEQPRLAYEEFQRVLKPGGLVIVEDGNFYLRLHDEDYAALSDEIGRRMEQNQLEKPKHYAPGSKELQQFREMERIAGSLPLSAIRRPQWDVETLLELGFGQLGVEAASVEAAGKNLPAQYIVTAWKKTVNWETVLFCGAPPKG